MQVLNKSAIYTPPIMEEVMVMVTIIISLSIVNILAALYKEKKLNERS